MQGKEKEEKKKDVGNGDIELAGALGAGSPDCS
jgi:hypothetical protein